MDSLQRRHESSSGVVFEEKKLPLNLSEFKEEVYDSPHNVTIYLGSDDGVFPEGFGLRLRFYNQEPFTDLAFIDEKQPCFFEIKLASEKPGDKTTKLRVETTFGQISNLLNSYTLLTLWLEDKNIFLEPEIISKLRKLFGEGRGVGLRELIPLAGVAYDRKHFQKPGERLTIDTGIVSFSAHKLRQHWILASERNLPYGVIERKTDDFSETLSLNQGNITNAPTSLNQKPYVSNGFSKFSLAKEAHAVSKHTDRLDGIDPEKIKQENLYPVTLGAVSSATKHMTALSLTNPDYFVLNPAEYSLSLPVYVDITSYIRRYQRILVHKASGLVFLITVKEDLKEATRESANTVTTEIIGRHPSVNKGGIIEIKNEDSRIYKEVQIAIYNYLKLGLLRPKKLYSKTELAEFHQENKQTDNIIPRGIWLDRDAPESTHARIKYLYRGEDLLISKEYDLSNSSLTLDEIMGTFQTYRQNVAKLYKVPETARLYKTSPSAFVSEEKYIQGRSGAEIIREGNMESIEKLLRGIIEPISKTILPALTLPSGKVSPFPVEVPMDLKPENFRVTADGALTYIDFFTPWLRNPDGSLKQIFRNNDGKNLVFGDFHIMLTKLLLWCTKENPETAVKIGQLLRTIVLEIDKDSRLISYLQKNAQSPKVLADFTKYKNAVDALHEFVGKDNAQDGTSVLEKERKLDDTTFLATLEDAVEDPLSEIGKSLIVRAGGKRFRFPGYIRNRGGEEVVRFVPFIRDDAELRVFGANQIAKIMDSLEHSPDFVILPYTSSTGFGMLDEATDKYRQIKQERGDHTPTISIPLINALKDPLGAEISWDNRSRLEFRSKFGLSADSVNILKSIREDQSICILDDTRRSGRSETTILKLLALALGTETLKKLVSSGRLKVVYLCSEYDAAEGPSDLGKSVKVAIQMPFIKKYKVQDWSTHD